jgi:PAS domain S-box-containing protein
LNETLVQRVLERTDELDRQRGFIETILETAEALIFVVDNQGRFVRFNRACERLTGYRFDELRGRPIWEAVITPERRELVRRKHENQLSPQGLEAHLEVEWLTKAGERRLISWSNAMITDGAGRLEYMIGTGIDVTERKRAEQALIVANQTLSQSLEHLRQTQSQLVQAEKLASLGSLVAGISHEINTPLGIGVTSATALQEEMTLLQREYEAGSMRRSSLERFLRQGQEGCSILVRNLLRAAELIRSFKQVAVDQSSDERREIELGRYIDEVVLSLQPKFKGRAIQVLNQSEPGLSIETHPGAIYQILSNLLINALLHAYEPQDKGTIRIVAQRIGDEIQLDCADDGKGIAPEFRDRIFDPFFTTRRGTGGSGLGLHIVFNLVASTLHGRIGLVEDGGRGTTFRIRFPVQHGAAA